MVSTQSHRSGPQTISASSLLDQKPRSASVVCDTDMTLLVLMQRHFQKILRASPSMSLKLLKTMGNQLRESDAMAYE